MEKKVKIAIVDSGISNESTCARAVSKSYVLKKYGNTYQVDIGNMVDYIGHGTAVASIIYSVNKDIDIICFRICDHELEINEIGLIFVLEYIVKYIDVDLINISAGLTYLYDFSKLHNICQRLTDKNVLIVSAFDNDGSITYPAAFREVIGVDVKKNYEDKNTLYQVKNSIVDLWIPNVFYRTVWGTEKAILKGSSFATAKVSGLLSEILLNTSNRDKECVLSYIAKNVIAFPKIKNEFTHVFDIKKAIIFPVNKESHALLRFNELLHFTICGVYDERLSGNISKVLLTKMKIVFMDVILLRSNLQKFGLVIIPVMYPPIHAGATE